MPNHTPPTSHQLAEMRDAHRKPPATIYTLPLAEILELEGADTFRGTYYKPEEPDERDFRVSAVLPDKRKDPWYPALLQDIRKYGLLTPIWIVKDEVIDGGHRIAAAQDLGLERLPCTSEEPEDPECSVRSYSLAMGAWTTRGWTAGERPATASPSRQAL